MDSRRVVGNRGIEMRKTAFRAPKTNAYVERFIQTIQQECLDHFVILGERHFNYLVAEWLEHYHTERPHQAKDNVPLVALHSRRRPSTKLSQRGSGIVLATEVKCTQRLGGLLKSYRRRAV